MKWVAGGIGLLVIATWAFFVAYSHRIYDEGSLNEISRIASDAGAVLVRTVDFKEETISLEAILPPGKKWNRTGKRSTGEVMGYEDEQVDQKLLEVIREGLTKEDEVLVP